MSREIRLASSPPSRSPSAHGYLNGWLARSPGVSELNAKWIDGFIQEFRAGAVSHSEALSRAQWRNMRSFLKTKESLDDYASFQYMVKDVFSSLLLSIVLENEGILKSYAFKEERQLQHYYFGAYLQSHDFIKYDSCPDQILKDDRLDVRSFHALSHLDILKLLDSHILELKKLNSIHELYACRKSLAKCEYIKWDSDFDEIFKRVKYEEKWSEVPDTVLKIALNQHLSLLHKLKNDKKAIGVPIANCAVTESLGSVLVEAVDGEYCAELLKFTSERVERRLELYREHEEFKHLVNQRVLQSQASRIEFLPKEYQLTKKWQPKTLMLEKLSQLKGVKPDSMHRLLSGLKDKLGGKPLGGSAKRWPVLIFSVVSFSGLVMVGRRV